MSAGAPDDDRAGRAAFRRLGDACLRRRAFTGSPLAVERRFILSPVPNAIVSGEARKREEPERRGIAGSPYRRQRVDPTGTLIG